MNRRMLVVLILLTSVLASGLFGGCALKEIMDPAEKYPWGMIDASTFDLVNGGEVRGEAWLLKSDFVTSVDDSIQTTRYGVAVWYKTATGWAKQPHIRVHPADDRKTLTFDTDSIPPTDSLEVLLTDREIYVDGACPTFPQHVVPHEKCGGASIFVWRGYYR